MKVENALKAAAKRNMTPVCVSSPEAVFNKRYQAEANGQRLILSTQGGEVATIRVHPLSDRDEFESDYCAGSFFDTLKQALDYMTRPVTFPAVNPK